MPTEGGSKYDLTFIDPDKRHEVSRRIDVLDRFIENPGRKRAEAAAKELGINVIRFYALVRIWRDNRKPERLVDGNRSAPTIKRVNPLVQAIILEVEDANRTAPAFRIERLAAPLVARAGLVMPTSPTIRTLVMEVRLRRDVDSPLGTGVALEFHGLEIRVPHGSGFTLPIGAFLLDLDRRRVLGSALGIKPSSALATRALLDALGRARPPERDEVPASSLRIDTAPEPGWALLTAALRAAGLETNGHERPLPVGGTALRSITGPKAGTFTLRPNAVAKPPERRRPRGIALGLEEAEALLRSRIAAGRHGQSARWILPPGTAEALEADLRKILAGDR